MIRRLVLTDEAQEDYQDILLHTLEKWGETQLEIYDALLDKALNSIKEDPRLGKKNRQLPLTYRVYHVGRHYIVFREEGEDVIIVRILHDQMDLKRHIH